MGILVLARRNPITAFYALTFAISWGGVLLVVGGPGGIPGTPDGFQRLLPLVGLALTAGPCATALLLTGILDGRAGYRVLLSRLLRCRFGARLYVIAMLTAPLAMTAIPLALSVLSPGFLPGVVSKTETGPLLLLGFTAGSMAGIFEELGWTGFAVPRLRRRHSSMATGIIVGVLWGAWHLLVNVWSSGSPSGGLSPGLFLHSVFFSLGVLPAFRTLMVWVYDRTEGSLLVAMLMHASLTASNVVLVPSPTGLPLVIWSLVVAASLWAVVAGLARSR